MLSSFGADALAAVDVSEASRWLGRTLCVPTNLIRETEENIPEEQQMMDGGEENVAGM